MPTFERLHLLDFAILFFCAIITGILSGIIINVLNGWLSPEYFSLFFFNSGGATWTSQELYFKTIEHGGKEGFWFGCCIAIIFTSYVFIVSRASCRFWAVAPYLLKMAVVVFAFWAMGGIDGSIYALFFPQALDGILDLGGTRSAAFKFIWVGFSIYGAYFGSLLSLIMGCIWFKKDWNHRLKLV